MSTGFEPLEERCLCAVDLQADVNTISPSSRPHFYAQVGGIAYFGADDRSGVRRLYQTDGSSAGTVLLFAAGGTGPVDPDRVVSTADRAFAVFHSEPATVWTLGPGVAPSVFTTLPGPIWGMTAAGDRLFLQIQSGATYGLWTTDGTEAGTRRVADSVSPSPLTAVGRNVMFTASDTAAGRELWFSDGTGAGTYRVKDIRPGLKNSDPTGLIAAGSNVFFIADDGVNGRELWKSDGTAAGTALVHNSPGTNAAWSTDYRASGNSLYYSYGYNVWRTDGTPAGTYPITAAGNGIANFYSPTPVGGAVYFGAQVAGGGQQLWRSTGTLASAAPVATLDSVQNGSFSLRAAVGGKLYFIFTPSKGRSGLYVSDGTAAGTARLSDPVVNSTWLTPMDLGGRAILYGYRYETNDAEPYVSDGTAAGTRLLKDINAAPTMASDPVSFGEVNGRLLYWAYSDADYGFTTRTLFAAEPGSPGVTALATTKMPTTGSVWVNPITTIGGRAYFAVKNDEAGLETWVTDGTPAGTRLLKDFNPGVGDGGGGDFCVTSHGVILWASDPEHGLELWSTDGTSEGTRLLVELTPGTRAPWLVIFGVAGGLCYFSIDGVLYRTDGTADGTIRLATVGPYAPSQGPRGRAVGDRMLFTAADPEHGAEMWVSDGTPGGTHLIRDLNAGPSHAYPTNLTVSGGRLFFQATVAGVGSELFASDGTEAGTRLVKDISPSSSSSLPQGLFDFDGTLLFSAASPAGRELWRSDGTPEGTVIVRDINPGAAAGTTWADGRFARIGGQLLFGGITTALGTELWATDGTAAGTHAVADVDPGTRGALANYSVFWGAAQGAVFFTAQTTAGGMELWQSDGTEGGTRMVADVYPGATGSDPREHVVAGGVLYFSAESDLYGNEVFRVTDDTRPRVNAARLEGGGAGTLVRAAFTEGVSIDLNRIEVFDRTRARRLARTEFGIRYDSLRAELIVYFHPDGGVPPLDGDYQLVVGSAAAEDSVGNSLAVDFTYDFFVLAGDANHDRAVDFNDLVALAQNYNGSGKTYAEGDFTGDGVVDFNDLVVLAQRYNSVPPQAAVAAVSSPVVKSEETGDTSVLQRTAPEAPAALPAPVARPVRPAFSTRRVAG